MNKPKIFLFCNTRCNHGRGDWHSGMAMAEDGTYLAGHLSSSHGFCKVDLGLVVEDDWSKKREVYDKHYPNGYECVWIDDPETNPDLAVAFKLNQKMGEDAKMEEKLGV